jgi:hypothetical protein
LDLGNRHRNQRRVHTRPGCPACLQCIYGPRTPNAMTVVESLGVTLVTPILCGQRPGDTSTMWEGVTAQFESYPGVTGRPGWIKQRSTTWSALRKLDSRYLSELNVTMRQ